MKRIQNGSDNQRSTHPSSNLHTHLRIPFRVQILVVQDRMILTTGTLGDLLVLLLCACCSSVVSGAKELVQAGKLNCEIQTDNSVICQFRVEQPSSFDEQAGNKQTLQLTDCPADSDYCIQASISTHKTTMQQEQKTATTTPATATTTDAVAEVDENGVIKVLSASYRPPLSQYGEQVAKVLNHLPLTLHDVEWSNWYLELGMAHYGSSLTEVDWYQMSLALNAFHRAVAVFETKGDDASLSAQEKMDRQLFLGSVYFQIAETYLVHPEAEHIDDALNYFQKALSIYSEARNSPTSSDNGLFFDRGDNDLRWADVCTRLGFVLVASVNPYQMDPNVESMGSQLQMEDWNKKVKESEALLKGAIDVYQKRILKLPDSQERVHTKIALATALQNAASTATLGGKLLLAKKWNLQALALHQDVLMPVLVKGTPEWESSRVTAADILLNLADTLLQLGAYDETKKYYKAAMDWHEEHNVEIAPMRVEVVDVDGGSEALQQHKDALDEYHRMVEGGSGGAGTKEANIYKGTMNDEQEFYYQRDDAYEGDLYSALGAIYLSEEEPVRAIAHFEKAISLYKNVGEENDPTMADVKINLAVVLFRVRRFQDSIDSHFDALDIYRNLYGDGVNPLEETMGAESSSTVIDLEKYKQSILNATAAKDEL
jgi:tetratricopeptide (TPR) repeat protein